MEFKNKMLTSIQVMVLITFYKILKKLIVQANTFSFNFFFYFKLNLWQFVYLMGFYYRLVEVA